jgi:HD-like signal output (HDOD) protein
MNRILFVDDEPAVLHGLRRTLHAMSGEWDLVFAGGGAEALERCAAEAFDVVVSDAQMPGMGGPDLLTQVMRRQPDSVRFILSGQFRWDLAIKSVGVAHQFWNKPCDPWSLMSAAQRVCNERRRFPDVAARKAVASIAALPSQPTAYAELVNRVKSACASIESATEIIARDVALTAAYVHLASSGFFSGPKHVSSSAGAVKLLGLKTIKALLQSPAASSWRPPTEDQQGEIRLLNDHSFAVAAAAKRIAESVSDDRTLIADAHLAGVLHDIAALALVAPPSGQPATDAAAGPLGTGHERSPASGRCLGPDLGGYLAAIWGLPDSIVQAISYHRCPAGAADEIFSPLSAVHVAHALLEPAIACSGGGDGEVDLNYLERIGCVGRLDMWRGICEASLAEAVSQ